MAAAVNTEDPRAALERCMAELRPRLHRYCARMTGSVIDGEDVVQDALVKAVAGIGLLRDAGRLESWLFRIAHNASLDYLRRRAREDALRASEDPEMIVDPLEPTTDPAIVEASLQTFMRLPAVQRSSVVLMDVLGYSLEEIGAITDSSVPAVKSALHRGRTRLRELAKESDDRPAPLLSAPQHALLSAYIARFNARDFGAVRDMLADEVQLELVNHARKHGRREVATYTENYAALHDWQLAPGLIDGRPAAIVFDPANPDVPAYFILLTWSEGTVIGIRDFRYARYAIEGAALTVL
jgi:RNA polymerase sigma-70 factor (ECF subfamily)